MVSATMAVCANCRFFKPLSPDEEPDALSGNPTEFGRCVRFPPVFVEEAVLNGDWPIVFNQLWCGEHEHPADNL